MIFNAVEEFKDEPLYKILSQDINLINLLASIDQFNDEKDLEKQIEIKFQQKSDTSLNF